MLQTKEQGKKKLKDHINEEEIGKLPGKKFSKDIKDDPVQGEEPRWRRSRTGRTLSPPQIHQKSI